MAEKAGGRHATWIELFFDLVVVAGAGQLAHLLHGTPSLLDLGLYVLLYVAFWTVWACFTVYGDVMADKARVTTMLVAMLGLAVMVAAVPQILGDHTAAFVLAYVFLRWMAGWIWSRGDVVVDWPLAQVGVGSAPWLLSLFVPVPYRYWLWALGVALDLGVLALSSEDGMLRNARARFDQVVRSRGVPPDARSVGVARADREHLAERLGLYVIIVLGEGVIQVIEAASEEHWTLPLDLTALGAFALLCCLWTLSLQYGFAGVPHLKGEALPTRFAMLLHCLTTAVLAALAAALGTATAEPGHFAATTRWLMCGSVAVYFAIAFGCGLVERAGRAWLLGWGLPCLLLPPLLGLLHLGAPWTVWLLTAVVAWQIAYAPGPPGVTERRPLRAMP